ncbi:MAG: biotin--[acetyl-CoA-carboxylase] ligase [Gemmatimonadota bacterium]
MSQTALLHRHDQLSSTLDQLHRLAEAGAVEGTAVVAVEQTAGRGSRGRTWHSPRGGLWLSWLCRPRSVVAGEVLSLRVGMAIASVLDQLGDLPVVELKWPNDVLIGGKKVAGILCEARWQGGEPGWIAVGIGLNVQNPVPDEVGSTATRLGDFCADVTADSFLAVLLPALNRITALPPRLTVAELASFAGRDFLKDRALREPVAGVARGIDYSTYVVLSCNAGAAHPAVWVNRVGLDAPTRRLTGTSGFGIPSCTVSIAVSALPFHAGPPRPIVAASGRRGVIGE